MNNLKKFKKSLGDIARAGKAVGKGTRFSSPLKAFTDAMRHEAAENDNAKWGDLGYEELLESLDYLHSEIAKATRNKYDEHLIHDRAISLSIVLALIAAEIAGRTR